MKIDRVSIPASIYMEEILLLSFQIVVLTVRTALWSLQLLIVSLLVQVTLILSSTGVEWQ